jgi:hypothetical protein
MPSTRVDSAVRAGMGQCSPCLPLGCHPAARGPWQRERQTMSSTLLSRQAAISVRLPVQVQTREGEGSVDHIP